MSETVHYTGKVKKLIFNNKQEREEFCKNKIIKHNLKKMDFYESYEECLVDELYNEFVLISDDLYEIIEKNDMNDNEIIKANKTNEENTFEYHLMYYNGGCGFSEALEEAINKIKD